MWFISQNYKFVEQFGSKLSELMLEVGPTYTRTRALRRRRHRKREAAFAASREHVTVQD